MLPVSTVALSKVYAMHDVQDRAFIETHICHTLRQNLIDKAKDFVMDIILLRPSCHLFIYIKEYQAMKHQQVLCNSYQVEKLCK